MNKVFNNYIGGKWVVSVSGKTFDNINPANTDEKIGAFQASTREDVDKACDAAVGARAQWAATPAPNRGEYLYKAAELLEARPGPVGRGDDTRRGEDSP